MRIEHEVGQRAFRDALSTLLDVVGGLSDEQLLAASRCRGWTVGDVLVHVHLGLQDMVLGMVSPTSADPDTDAAEYWRGSVPSNDDTADEVAQIRFVRLLGAAYRRPSGLIGHLRPTAGGALSAAEALVPGALRFQDRVLSTGDFLATWAVELAIHHLDLGRELDVPPPAPEALGLARRTVEELAGGRLPDSWPDDVAVLLAAGRLPLDPVQHIEAGSLADKLPSLG